MDRSTSHRMSKDYSFAKQEDEIANILARAKPRNPSCFFMVGVPQHVPRLWHT
jgi:hypothetical protein